MPPWLVESGMLLRNTQLSVSLTRVFTASNLYHKLHSHPLPLSQPLSSLTILAYASPSHVHVSLFPCFLYVSIPLYNMCARKKQSILYVTLERKRSYWKQRTAASCDDWVLKGFYCLAWGALESILNHKLLIFCLKWAKQTYSTLVHTGWSTVPNVAPYLFETLEGLAGSFNPSP